MAQLVKNLHYVGDLGLIPGLGRSPREGKGYPLQLRYESFPRAGRPLRRFRGAACSFSPHTASPGLQQGCTFAAGHWERQGHFSLPSGPRVGNLQDPAAGVGQEDPLEKEMSINFPGESHRQRSLAGYSPWGQKELDMIE